MYKFFLPLLIILIGLWFYVGIYEYQQKEKQEISEKIIKKFDTYTQINDSIKDLPQYKDFRQKNYYGLTFFIPGHLEAVSDLSTTAVLQYENTGKELYLILNTEATNYYYYSLEDYSNAVFERLKTAVSDFTVVRKTEKHINNSKQLFCEATGNLTYNYQPLPIRYYILISEFENNFYELTVWTIDEYFEKNSNDMELIINSVTNLPDINTARQKL